MKTHFNNNIPIEACVLQVVPFPRVSPAKPCMHLSGKPKEIFYHIVTEVLDIEHMLSKIIN
jgi:hypothetical protein